MTDFVPFHNAYKISSKCRENLSAKSALLLSLALTLVFMQTANAACKGINCACFPSELQFASSTLAPAANGKYPISLEADDVEAQGEDLVTLTGNAEVSQGRRTIVADQIQYYRANDRVVAKGNVEMISQNGDYLSSDSIDVFAPTQIGTLQNTEFKLARSISSDAGVDTVQIDSRGSAAKVDLEGENLVRLENAKYTTCKEGNNSVMISGRNLELDRAGGVGVARHATVKFKGVPIFYSPYLSFPLNDERKTGFLTPGFGDDEESGNVFEFPWYWNIAKNQDATITPRYFTDRGTQLAVEYRHQSSKSNTFVYGEVLPDDDLFGDDRDLFSLQHSHQFTDNLSGQINYNDVSDADYFDDLRNDVRYFSASYVPRAASLRYSAKYFTLDTFVSEFQIIDPDVSEDFQPYERLPSISFRTKRLTTPWGLDYGLDANHTEFSSPTRVEGSRTALTPYAELPFESIWGYVKPRVSIHNRNYSLSDNLSEGQEDSPSFTVPIFSVDAGVYLERNASWFGEGALHTLEPRIYYVYAPEEDQDDAPLFDTGVSSLNSSSGIFRENRFSGFDRVGDTNQVTIGATTRIIDNETGRQRLQASVGQLYLIDDLEQGLNPDDAPIESGLGDLLVEMRTTSKDAWGTYTFIRYDHDLSEFRNGIFSVAYQPETDTRKKVSMGYSFFKNATDGSKTDQLTLDVNWPITDRWSFYGNERYLPERSESLSTTLGVEYNSCCWKLRFTGQERISNRDIDDKKQSFFVELELTSLGRVSTGL